MAYSLSEGETLVRAARFAIDLHIKSPKFNRAIIEGLLEGFNEQHGIFVTLEYYPTMSLRGCIGFPRPSGHIKKRLIDAAIAASSEDPRFVPVSASELGEIVVEVSVLSVPKLMAKKTAEARERAVKIGRDGLIVQYGFHSGLLLPIVAVEQGWDRKRFLDGVCEKAGLIHDLWKRPEVELYTFTAQIFKEASPEGIVEEVILK